MNLPEIIFDLLYPDRVSSVLDGREINMKGYFKYKNKFYKLTLPNVKNQDYICLSWFTKRNFVVKFHDVEDDKECDFVSSKLQSE